MRLPPHAALFLLLGSCWAGRGGTLVSDRRRNVACACDNSCAAESDAACSSKRGRYFGCVAFAGALSCSITHSIVVPLDVIKTQLQTDPDLSGPRAAISSLLARARSQGVPWVAPFFEGLGATTVGYLMQGATKFGGYEVFKRATFGALQEQGPTGYEIAQRFRLPIMLASAATAEIVASAVLCPLEVIKLRMQTSPALASQGLRRACLHILRHEGLAPLFKGFLPVAMRQVPYTAFKLVSFELAVSGLSRTVQQRHAAATKALASTAKESGQAARFTERDATAIADRHRMSIVMAAGLIAGAIGALVSQPFDLLLTRMCGSADVMALSECVVASESVRDQLRYLVSLGPRAFTGLGPRMMMVALMSSIQFIIYDSVRLAVRCPRVTDLATRGHEVAPQSS